MAIKKKLNPQIKPKNANTKIIDWDKVDQLIQHQCTGVEIAGYFDMHEETFYKKVMEEKGVGFTGYSLSKKQKGKSLLRDRQFLKAMDGDSNMLIKLGSYYLPDQSEDKSKSTDAPNQELIDARDQVEKEKYRRLVVEEELRILKEKQL